MRLVLLHTRLACKSPAISAVTQWSWRGLAVARNQEAHRISYSLGCSSEISYGLFATFKRVCFIPVVTCVLSAGAIPACSWHSFALDSMDATGKAGAWFR